MLREAVYDPGTVLPVQDVPINEPNEDIDPRNPKSDAMTRMSEAYLASLMSIVNAGTPPPNTGMPPSDTPPSAGHAPLPPDAAGEEA
jgi:hypothetical protein